MSDTNTAKQSALHQQCKEREGIILEPRLSQENPGLNAAAKLMLNSFWGKFREILLKPTTAAVYNAFHLFALVSNPFSDKYQVRIANDDSLEVVYANLKDNQPDNGRVNIFVAAFITCHARLKVY